jgi:hypothetical protein
LAESPSAFAEGEPANAFFDENPAALNVTLPG